MAEGPAQVKLRRLSQPTVVGSEAASMSAAGSDGAGGGGQQWWAAVVATFPAVSV
jgi:hypothetical protein